MTFHGDFGLALDVRFPMIKAGVRDFAASGDWTPATGDTKLVKDGANAANSTNNPSAVAGTGSVTWKLTLTATEMSADEVVVQIVDSSTKAVEDQMLVVQTKPKEVLMQGLATGGSTTTIVNSGLSLTTDQLVGCIVEKYESTGGSRESRVITANTSTTLTVSSAFATAAASGTRYRIYALGAVPASLDSNGRVDVSKILGTALTEGAAGRLAGGFQNFFNVASPTGTVNSLPSAIPGASNGLLISGTNSGTTTLGALTVTGTMTVSDGVVIARSSANQNGMTITGNGTGHGLSLVSGSGATGNALNAASASTNGSGFNAAGTGTGAGMTATGGATGNGFSGVGGSSSGAGLRLAGTAGNSPAATFLGQGSAAGILSTGGTTGEGARFVGGATSGVGMAVLSSAGNSIGMTIAGNGTGAGATVTGGATGAGLRVLGGATSGNALEAVAQAGNSNAFTLTKQGTGVELGTVGTNIDTLLTRITSARAGYLDNLNVGGNVASSAEVTALTNNTRVRLSVPSLIENPDSSTITYRVELMLCDENGNMEAPDSAPTVTLVNQSGTSRSSRLDSTTMALVSTGLYRVIYTATAGDTLEQLNWTFSVIEGGATKLYPAQSLIVDQTQITFTSADRVKLDAIHAKLPSKTYLTGTGNADGDVDMGEATGNYPGSVGSVAGNVAGSVASMVSLSATRIGYLDNLSAGPVAQASALTTTNSTVNAIKTISDKFDTMVELDVSVYRFTTNALEQGGGGGGGGGTFTGDDRTKLEAIYNKLPSKLYLTGTANTDGDIEINDATGNYPGSVGSVAGAVASVTGNVGGNVAGNVGGNVSTIGATGLAAIKTQLSNLLFSDAHAEPTSMPASNAPIGEKIGFQYMLVRNRKRTTKTGDNAGLLELFAANSATVVVSAALSDNGTDTVGQAAFANA
jgi:hypothetical protein